MPTRASSPTAIGKRIRDARLVARMSPQQLATGAGVTASAVRMWETGRRVPKDPFAVADALGVDPYWLMGIREPKVKLAANGTEPR